MPNVTLKSVSIPHGRRAVVFSDVHGAAASLRNVIDQVRLSASDILFPVGDYTERGADSIGVLREMMRLCRTYEAYPLLGNVDAYVLWMFHDHSPNANTALRRALAAEGGRFAKEARDALGLAEVPALNPSLYVDPAARLDPSSDESIPEEDAAALNDFREKVQKAFALELAWLRSLPTIVDTERFIFVHGGLPHENLDALVGTNAYHLMKNDNFLGQGLRFSRWIIVGHWPVTLYRPHIPSAVPYIAESQRIIGMDGGCGVKLDGQLNAMVIPDAQEDRFEFYMADSLPERVALDRQEASRDSFSIRWGDHYVHILRREGDRIFVRHLSTERTLWIPESFLFRDGDPAEIDDATDYALPVEQGDRLKLVCETSQGAVVKKNGVTGWYYGRLK
ncbi:MAG: metallophosphoesterase [Clostridiaceae bacterium]|nr:metallophosphoesterase [Clostridiaceae bacterium]